ncbi:hypothetical protein KSP35_14185 [Aquihabitans sp. G128]|uniref:hypothetical protein n=1 Tax=Aquihabitans sp. G128 TaxID=2849779 RepID=UPI001C2450BC|nr:hypothetical protein [Aquihabitans sp. G128]QXC59533.1 hypothetical protein KSP35_14185 [Aquihabitans sp. G128]
MSDGALTENAWLLKSKVNPFPVGGELAFQDGRLTFELGALAGEAFVGWVEEELGTEGLADRLKAGEKVKAFDHGLDEVEVSWPKLYAGAWMQVEPKGGGRTWLVAYDYPSGGSIGQTLSLMSGRKKGKAWKKALGV